MSGGPGSVRPRIYRLGGELATDWMFFLVRPPDGGLSIEKNTLKTVLGGVILHIAQKGFSTHGRVRGSRRRRARPERSRAAWSAPFPSGAAPLRPGSAARLRVEGSRAVARVRAGVTGLPGIAVYAREGCLRLCPGVPLGLSAGGVPLDAGGTHRTGAAGRGERVGDGADARAPGDSVAASGPYPGVPGSMPAAPTSPDLPLRTRTDHGRPGRGPTCPAARVGPRSAVRPRGGAPCPGARGCRQLEIYNIKVVLPYVVAKGEQRVTIHMKTVVGVHPWQPEEGAGNRAPSAWSATGAAPLRRTGHRTNSPDRWSPFPPSP
jgi:hypothetical protein